jgi:hypothetical protein
MTIFIPLFIYLIATKSAELAAVMITRLLISKWKLNKKQLCNYVQKVYKDADYDATK